jgi:voltage-gated potassium channel Kch
LARKQSSETLRRPQKVLWISFPIIAACSLVLGYLGLHRYLASDPTISHRPFDLLYNDLQLFVLGSDAIQQKQGALRAGQSDSLPLGLQIARFSAPAVTIYAVVEAIRLLLAVEVSRLRARRSSGHAIVCGDTALANALTGRLQADGMRVVEIRTEPDEFVSPGEPLRIIGDARDPRVLGDAGVDHAATVYACAESSAENIAIALAVTRAARPAGEPIFVYSLVADPDFCATVQAFFLGRRRPGRVRLDFFNIDHIAARRLFADNEPFPRSGPAPRILVAGTDGFAQAIVVEAARRWRACGGPDGKRLRLCLVGRNATLTLKGLSQRYPFLASVCDLQARDTDLMPLIHRAELPEPPSRVLITYPDEEYALKTAMTAERYWRGRCGPITVRLDGAMIGGATASGRLDGATGTVHMFGAVVAAGDPELIRDDLTERLARVLHDRYVLGRRSRGDDHRAEQAMVSWEELPVHLRRANRSQAEDIGRKLAKIGYVITPRYAEQQEAVLAEAEVDRLAMMEHDRWCDEKQKAGWSYAPRLDEARKLHPGLLQWNELSESMRLRNYDPFRELPAVLGEAGFQIVRVRP